jgi:hypothetical protein
MSVPKIVAIIGRSRSGKDTLASVVVARYGGVHRVVRLAAPVKAAACALFQLDADDVEGPQKDLRSSAMADLQQQQTPRAAMVWLTDAVRLRMGPAFFSRRLFRDYDAGLFGDSIVIPDLRYPEDVAEAKARGAFVIKVARPVARGGTSHAWEDTIDALEADVEVVNDGSLPDLLQCCRAIGVPGST